MRRMERRFDLSILFQQQLLEMLGNRLSSFMGEMNLHNFRQVALIQEIHVANMDVEIIAVIKKNSKK